MLYSKDRNFSKSVSGTPEEEPRSGGAFAFPPQNPDSARIRHAPRGSSFANANLEVILFGLWIESFLSTRANLPTPKIGKLEAFRINWPNSRSWRLKNKLRLLIFSWKNKPLKLRVGQYLMKCFSVSSKMRQAEF